MTDIHEVDHASPCGRLHNWLYVLSGAGLAAVAFLHFSGASADEQGASRQMNIAREIAVIERSVDLAGSNIRDFYPAAKAALAVTIRSGKSITKFPASDVLICVHGADGVMAFEGRVGTECATSSILPGSCGSQLVIENEAPTLGAACDGLFTLLEEGSEK